MRNKYFKTLFPKLYRCEEDYIESNFPKTDHHLSVFLFQVFVEGVTCVRAHLCGFVLSTVLPSCQRFACLIYPLLCGIVQILQAGVGVRVCRFVFMTSGDVC